MIAEAAAKGVLPLAVEMVANGDGWLRSGGESYDPRERGLQRCAAKAAIPDKLLLPRLGPSFPPSSGPDRFLRYHSGPVLGQVEL